MFSREEAEENKCKSQEFNEGRPPMNPSSFFFFFNDSVCRLGRIDSQTRGDQKCFGSVFDVFLTCRTLVATKQQSNMFQHQNYVMMLTVNGIYL